MYLYHGGTEIIEKPEVRTANRPIDFAKLRADFRKANFGIVNIYEINEKLFADFSVLKFEKPSEQWFDFVVDCRRGGRLFEKYDLIIGPVANDRVFRVLDFYEAGVYSKEYAINELLPYKLSNQYVFFNKELISSLKFAKYAEVRK
jgi:hypothetical protein